MRVLRIVFEQLWFCSRSLYCQKGGTFANLAAPTSYSKQELQTQTSIQFALTLECIWKLRNQVVHNGAQINILTTVKALDLKVVEHVMALKETNAKESLTSHLELAWLHLFMRIVVESDAKLVVAAINDLDNEAYWKIRPHCIDANSFISSFTSWSFEWVKRGSNSVAHTLAKSMPSHCPYLCCNKDSLSCGDQAKCSCADWKGLSLSLSLSIYIYICPSSISVKHTEWQIYL